MRVGRYWVPWVQRAVHEAVFAGGARGPREAGTYQFWQVTLRDGVPVLIRQRKGRNPAERVNRIARERRTAPRTIQRQVYASLWERVMGAGRNVQRIERMSLKDVAYWLDAHPDDARFLTRMVLHAR
jgi:hypothetical protein